MDKASKKRFFLHKIPKIIEVWQNAPLALVAL
jgi:hypothetical protein